MPKLKINDAEIYYEIHGQGHPVILIPGYGCDHYYWMPILSKLSKHYQVITLDNRGAGQTTDLGEPLSIKLMATDIVELISVLGLNRPHLVGSSMGGMIAQTVASRHPDMIGKLCLTNTTTKCRLAVTKGFRTMLELREKNIDVSILLDGTIPWLFGEHFLKQTFQLNILKKMILENPYFQSSIDQKRQFKALELFDGRKQLKNITAETLVIYGAEDIISLPQEALFLKDNIKHATIERVDGGHTPVLESPENFFNLLLNFFE